MNYIAIKKVGKALCTPYPTPGQKIRGTQRCGNSVTGNRIPQSSTKNADKGKNPSKRGDTWRLLSSACGSLSQGIHFSHTHVFTVHQTLSRLQGPKSDREVPALRETMEIRKQISGAGGGHAMGRERGSGGQL